MRWGSLVVAGFVVLLGSVGCTSSVDGTAGPPATPDGATRPREVHLAGVDPCSLLSERQRKDLGLDQPPVLDESRSAAHGGGMLPLCSFVGTTRPFVAAAISLSTSGGIELWRSDSVAGAPSTSEVRGFPALVVHPASETLDSICFLVVDMAAGEAMEIQFVDGGNSPRIPLDELCRKAGELGSTAIENLLTK